jgi:hypothetical protein
MKIYIIQNVIPNLWNKSSSERKKFGAARGEKGIGRLDFKFRLGAFCALNDKRSLIESDLRIAASDETVDFQFGVRSKTQTRCLTEPQIKARPRAVSSSSTGAPFAATLPRVPRQESVSARSSHLTDSFRRRNSMRQNDCQDTERCSQLHSSAHLCCTDCVCYKIRGCSEFRIPLCSGGYSVVTMFP